MAFPQLMAFADLDYLDPVFFRTTSLRPSRRLGLLIASALPVLSVWSL
jgi:hypothetical protein